MDSSFNKYDVYTTSGSIYCYKDTNILYNRFNIRDSAELKEIEADITTIRQQDMLEKPVKGHFTINHLCVIHKYLFGDIYPFAGHIRRESIAKRQTVFESPQSIKNKLSKLLGNLKQEKYLTEVSKEQFIIRLAFYFAELNYIHPFREGNGRATREFIRLLLLYNGYMVEWSLVEVETLLDAMEVSVFELSPLINVLDKCVFRDNRC